MKRTNKPPKADAILTADLHLSETTPVSRVDDYLAAQGRKLAFLSQLSFKHGGCPILCAGDVFDRWRASPWFCSWVYDNLPEPFITIPGNHDLPAHSPDQYEKSALSLMAKVGKAEVLQTANLCVKGLIITGMAYGTLNELEAQGRARSAPEGSILMLHELVWPLRKPGWSKGSYSAEELIDRYGGTYRLILTGDNHESFTVEKGGCLLVNPGSMMRITASQIGTRPRCYLYYANENRVAPVYYPIEDGVHNISHLNNKKERNARIAAYVERLSTNWKGGLSFRENLRAFFEENGTPKKVREAIWQTID